MKKENKIFKLCPVCKNKIFYKKESYKVRAEKNESLCSCCSIKGEKNPFFGKKHSKKTKELISKKNRTRNDEEYINYRFCPKCKKKITYKTIGGKLLGDKKGSLCLSCSSIGKKHSDETKKKMSIIKKKEVKEEDLVRVCSECNKEIKYSSKHSKKQADKKKSLCKSCCKIGNKNSFFKKKHSKESMNKMLKTKETSEAYKRHLEYCKTEDFKEKFCQGFKGENNPRYGGVTLKSLWIKKYGKEEGEHRDKEWKEKLSKINSGENNNMYGKPSPQGSGNGWSGWYNGWFFRSLRELSYMINVIEKNNFSWENGEKKKYKIKYIDYKGQERNYFSDFILEEKKMIECKPKNLHNSVNVKLKTEAAIKFCKKNGMNYELVDPEILSNEEMNILYKAGKIKFMDRYEKKFKETYLKN